MRGVLRILLATMALLTFACSAQTSTEFKEDVQYKRVREVQTPPDPKKILVEEVFWFGCPHCYAFDPKIRAWVAKKPADVDFALLPSSLGRPDGILHSKALYTAEALGVEEKIHVALFKAIHEQGQPLNRQDAIGAFFNRQTGVLPDVFDATFTGFAVDSRVRRAEALVRSYGVASTPTVIVGGKYYTNTSLAKDFPTMIQVIDFLVEKVRKERKK